MNATKEMNMTCRIELESEDLWREYLNLATEDEADAALLEVLMFAKNFADRHKPTSERMYKMFDSGTAIYAERFQREWPLF